MSLITKYVLISVDEDTLIAGARKVESELNRVLAELDMSKEIMVVETGTMGIMGKGVVMLIQPDDVTYVNVAPEDVREIVNEHLIKGRPVKRLQYTGKVDQSVISFRETAQELKKQKRIVLANSGLINPESIEENIAVNGYEALGKAVTEHKPEEIIDYALSDEHWLYGRND